MSEGPVRAVPPVRIELATSEIEGGPCRAWADPVQVMAAVAVSHPGETFTRSVLPRLEELASFADVGFSANGLPVLVQAVLDRLQQIHVRLWRENAAGNAGFHSAAVICAVAEEDRVYFIKTSPAWVCLLRGGKAHPVERLDENAEEASGLGASERLGLAVTSLPVQPGDVVILLASEMNWAPDLRAVVNVFGQTADLKRACDGLVNLLGLQSEGAGAIAFRFIPVGAERRKNEENPLTDLAGPISLAALGVAGAAIDAENARVAAARDLAEAAATAMMVPTAAIEIAPAPVPPPPAIATPTPTVPTPNTDAMVTLGEAPSPTPPAAPVIATPTVPAAPAIAPPTPPAAPAIATPTVPAALSSSALRAPIDDPFAEMTASMPRASLHDATPESGRSEAERFLESLGSDLPSFGSAEVVPPAPAAVEEPVEAALLENLVAWAAIPGNEAPPAVGTVPPRGLPAAAPADATPATPYVSGPAAPADATPATPYVSGPAAPADATPATPYVSGPAAPADATPATPYVSGPAAPADATPYASGPAALGPAAAHPASPAAPAGTEATSSLAEGSAEPVLVGVGAGGGDEATARRRLPRRDDYRSKALFWPIVLAVLIGLAFGIAAIPGGVSLPGKGLLRDLFGERSNSTATGQLRVESDPPPRRIFVAGRDPIDASKIQIESMPVGRHKVALDLGPCGIWETEVEVREGELTELRPKLVGSVQIAAADPLRAGRVWVEGGEKQSVPATLDGLSVGWHRVFYEDDALPIWERQVLVRTDRVAAILVPNDVAKSEGMVKVEALVYREKEGLVESRGDSVWVDERLAGRTPFEARLEPGLHSVRVAVDGDHHTEMLDLRGGASSFVVAQFGLGTKPRIRHSSPGSVAVQGNLMLTAEVVSADGSALSRPVLTFPHLDSSLGEIPLAPVESGQNVWVAIVDPSRLPRGEEIRYYFSGRSNSGEVIYSGLYSLSLEGRSTSALRPARSRDRAAEPDLAATERPARRTSRGSRTGRAAGEAGAGAGVTGSATEAATATEVAAGVTGSATGAATATEVAAASGSASGAAPPAGPAAETDTAPTAGAAPKAEGAPVAVPGAGEAPSANGASADGASADGVPADGASATPDPTDPALLFGTPDVPAPERRVDVR